MVRELPRFERRREGSFRAWLRKVAANRARSYSRKRRRRPAVGLDLTDGFLDRMVDPRSELARELDREHDEFVVQRLLSIVQPDFQPTTWEAFQRFALDGQPAARRGRGTGPDRERRPPGQVADSQEVTRRSRGPLEVISHDRQRSRRIFERIGARRWNSTASTSRRRS